jgi:hypothetical protein
MSDLFQIEETVPKWRELMGIHGIETQFKYFKDRPHVNADTGFTGW